jgi:hypothetical protein
MQKGPHALVLGGLNVFINSNTEYIYAAGDYVPVTGGLNFIADILEYIYAEGAYAPVTEGLHIFANDVAKCIDKVGLHVLVMGTLNSFKLYLETIYPYSIILCSYDKLRSANSYQTS